MNSKNISISQFTQSMSGLEKNPKISRFSRAAGNPEVLTT
jgi:hypothetical protein